MHQPSPGFTLIELAVVLAIVALLLSTATPAFQRLRADWQIAAASQALLVGLHHARSVAATRNEPVVLCQTDAGGACLGSTANVATGWRVFIERELSSPPRLHPRDEPLAEFALPSQVLLYGTRSAVTYWAGARAGTTATFVLCDAQQVAPPRAVIVSQTGRPRAARVAADGSALTCPA